MAILLRTEPQPELLSCPPERNRRVSIVVPYTDNELTRRALQGACRLALELDTPVTLFVVQIVAVMHPVLADGGQCLRDLRAIAEQVELPVRVAVVCAGDTEALRPGALIVIACRRRVWQTREERLAMKLARSGYRVTIVPA